MRMRWRYVQGVNTIIGVVVECPFLISQLNGFGINSRPSKLPRLFR
jgi:hypothetical protein